MHRRLPKTLLLAGLLVLAGCTGTTGSSTTVAEPEPTATPTATTMPTPDPTPEPAVKPGQIDAGAVADRHTAAIRDAGSYTMRTNISFDGFNESSPVGAFATLFSLSNTIRVDLEAGRSLSVGGSEHPEMPTTETYVDAERGQTFRRSATQDGNVTYQTFEYVPAALQNSTDAGAKQMTGGDQVERWLSTVNFSVVGVEQVDGQSFTRLEAEGPDSHAKLNEGLNTWNDSDYESMRTTMLIDDEGIVRELRYEIVVNTSGEAATSTMTIRWTDVGSTTVQEPNWLDEAQTTTTETDAKETETTG